MNEYISKNRVKDYIHATNSTQGFTSYEDYVWLLDTVINAPAANVQPLSVVAEHIKNRLYETAFNEPDTVISDTIAAMAERIDFWIDELKDGETNDINDK